MRQKITFLLAILIFFGLLYSFSTQIYASIQAGKRLDTAAEELLKLQQKNSELKKKLTEVESIEFLEKQARDKLNLARSGETVVIIPQKEIDRVLGLEKKGEEEVKLPNWQGWLKLFFK